MRSEALRPLKVVYDTNVLISAYFFGGQPRVALDLARRRRVALLLSTDTMAEFIRVLGYQKFGLTAQEIQPLVEDLLTFSEQVPIDSIVNCSGDTASCNDPRDRRPGDFPG